MWHNDYCLLQVLLVTSKHEFNKTIYDNKVYKWYQTDNNERTFNSGYIDGFVVIIYHDTITFGRFSEISTIGMTNEKSTHLVVVVDIQLDNNNRGRSHKEKRKNNNTRKQCLP